MKKIASIALLATAATFAAPAAFAAETQPVAAMGEEAATLDVTAGKMLYSADGRRIASIYRVSDAGNPQVILNGKLMTVPASTLTTADGKIVTSLTKKEIATAR